MKPCAAFTSLRLLTISLWAICASMIPTAGFAAVKPIHALLITGGCCHDYAKQKDILKKGLEERANIVVTLAYDPDKTVKHLNPVYEKTDWAAGYDLILHDECSADVTDMKAIDNILKPHKDGLPG